MGYSHIKVRNLASCVSDALTQVRPSAAHQAIFDDAKVAAEAVLATSKALDDARVANKEARLRVAATAGVLYTCYQAVRPLAGLTHGALRDPFRAVAGPRPNEIVRASRNRRVLLLAQLLPGLATAAKDPLLRGAVTNAEVALAAARAAQSDATDKAGTLVDARKHHEIATAAWEEAYAQLRLAAELEWPGNPGIVAKVLGKVDRTRGTGGGHRKTTPAPAPMPPAPAPAPPG